MYPRVPINDGEAPVKLPKDLIAKGLAPRQWASLQKLQPLVQKALDRILRPQVVGSARVDMRNLAMLFCVKKKAQSCAQTGSELKDALA